MSRRLNMSSFGVSGLTPRKAQVAHCACLQRIIHFQDSRPMRWWTCHVHTLLSYALCLNCLYDLWQALMDMGSLNLAEPAQPAAQPAHQPLGAIENVPPPAPPPQQQKPLFAKVKVSCQLSRMHCIG